MIYKYLGNTGIRIPAIVQGTTGIGSYDNFNPDSVKERIKVLKTGIDLGLNFIDTAELYGGGFAEEVVGQTIRGIRENIFLASKFNPKKDVYKSVIDSVENSLRRLNTDYIDLYQIHWPNPSIPIEEVMNALYKLVKVGKIRFVGVSNFSLNDFRAAQDCFNEEIVSNQIEYNLLERSPEDDFMPYCDSNNITLFAYSPLNQGRLFFNNEQKLILLSLAKKYSKTIAQMVLRWLIEHTPIVAITKTKSIDRIKEIYLSMDFDIENDDLDAISNFSKLNFIEVPIDKIRIGGITEKPILETLDEAIANKLDLIPSPINLAKLLKKGDRLKPIRLVPTTDGSGKFLYDIDSYDPMDHVKKYWAWILAFGYDKPIPAFILNSSNEI